MVRRLGADEVIDYTTEDYTKGGKQYDWILDVAGTRSIFDCRRALNPSGVYVLLRHNAQDFRLPVLGPADLAGNTEEDGIPVVEPFHRDDVALLKRLIAEGKINPVIDRTYLFSELREAISYLEIGKRPRQSCHRLSRTRRRRRVANVWPLARGRLHLPPGCHQGNPTCPV